MGISEAVISSGSLWCNQEPHRLSIVSPQDFPRAVADQVVEALQQVLSVKSHAVFCPSAGRTVRPVYRILATEFREIVDWNRVVCVQMDEYADLPCTDSKSLCADLREHLIGPLGIERFHHFYGALEPWRTPELHEYLIREMGGLDLVLHGVGVNGHVGFNEPLSADMSRTRRVALDESTRLANRVGFTEAVTLGMSLLASARSTIIAISGKHKREVARRLIFGPPHDELPASRIRVTSATTLLLDGDAAGEACYQNPGFAHNRG